MFHPVIFNPMLLMYLFLVVYSSFHCSLDQYTWFDSTCWNKCLCVMVIYYWKNPLCSTKTWKYKLDQNRSLFHIEVEVLDCIWNDVLRFWKQLKQFFFVKVLQIAMAWSCSSTAIFLIPYPVDNWPVRWGQRTSLHSSNVSLGDENSALRSFLTVPVQK